MYTFIELPAFSRLADDYFSREELAELQRFNPQAGDVIPGTGGVRKLRWQRPGMGKRGGLRLLYYGRTRPHLAVDCVRPKARARISRPRH